MLSLSTSYFAIDQVSGIDIAQRLKTLNICGLELSCKIDVNLFSEFRDLINQSQIQVSSVHSFAPVPDTAPQDE